MDPKDLRDYWVLKVWTGLAVHRVSMDSKDYKDHKDYKDY